MAKIYIIPTKLTLEEIQRFEDFLNSNDLGLVKEDSCTKADYIVTKLTSPSRIVRNSKKCICPVVQINWLLDCIEFGKELNPVDYLIDVSEERQKEAIELSTREATRECPLQLTWDQVSLRRQSRKRYLSGYGMNPGNLERHKFLKSYGSRNRLKNSPDIFSNSEEDGFIKVQKSQILVSTATSSLKTLDSNIERAATATLSSQTKNLSAKCETQTTHTMDNLKNQASSLIAMHLSSPTKKPTSPKVSRSDLSTKTSRPGDKLEALISLKKALFYPTTLSTSVSESKMETSEVISRKTTIEICSKEEFSVDFEKKEKKHHTVEDKSKDVLELDDPGFSIAVEVEKSIESSSSKKDEDKSVATIVPQSSLDQGLSCSSSEFDFSQYSLSAVLPS